jgi:hypothetical protein
LRRNDARQFVIDDPRESLQRLGAGNLSAIDEESRRAAYADPIPFRDIFFDSGLIFSAIHACFEGVSIEPDFLCQLFKDLWTTFRRSVVACKI